MNVGIAGGGLSGLTCAYWLNKFGISFHLFEKAATPGGKIKTIEKDGFLLDLGFQVFLPAYSEAQKVLDYDELQLFHFDAGAVIWNGQALIDFPDPLRKPEAFFKILKTPFLSFRDALAMARLFEETNGLSQDEVFGPTMGTTADYLKELNFSKSFVDNFWRPFFRGIFLEKDLNTEARFFRFLFYCFKNSFASLPAKGMQQIPLQIANRLQKSQLHFDTELKKDQSGNVIFPEEYGPYNFKVMAFDTHLAEADNTYNGTTTLYYKTPLKGSRKSIYLNAKENCMVNNIAFLADVNPNYAPSNYGLAAASVIHQKPLTDTDLNLIYNELYEIFGTEVAQWELLDTFYIPHALPKMQARIKPAIQVHDNTLYIGDHTTYPSINGAMLSGRLAAEWIKERLR